MRKTIKQTVDYGDFLRTLAADLTGGASLACEVIQNADDAPEVTSLIFDFRAEALHIKNNGSFRDEDYQRLQKLAGGGKRTEAGTTGAFGVGFTSVYQITDHPTIRSAGQQWTLFPEDDGRIEVEEIHDDGHTEFILPWARNPESDVRQLLQQPAVTQERIHQLQQETHAVLPLALVFLRKLTELRLSIEGKVLVQASRRCKDRVVEIVIDDDVDTFVLLEADFKQVASSLRQRFPAVIEKKRSAEVRLAISASLERGAGRVFAYLPTEMHSGIPVHLNADFFARTNRKGIDLEGAGKAEWNEAALACMATGLASSLLDVRDALEPVQFLDLLDAVCASDGGVTADRPAGGFWSAVAPIAVKAPVVLDHANQWRQPQEVCYPPRGEDEYECIDALRMLELALVHPDLRRFKNLLTGKNLGVRSLNLGLLLEKLHTTHRIAEICAKPARHAQLAKLVTTLLDAEPRNQAALDGLRAIPMVWAGDSTLRAPRDVRTADEALAQVISALDLSSHVATDRTPAALLGLCEPLAAADALEMFESIDSAQWQRLWETDRASVLQLHRWLVDRAPDWRDDETLVIAIRSLPIWPSAGRVQSLDELVVPGGFEDPLGLAAVLDVEALRDSGSLFSLVGARELTIQSFAMEHIPRVLNNGQDLGQEVRRRVVSLLADHRSRLVNHPGVHAALAHCPLVECADREFRPASECYFPSSSVRDVLGPRASLVSASARKNAAVRELYEWLGVASAPRPADVLQRVEDLAGGAPTKANIAAVARIVTYLARSWPQWSDSPGPLGQLKGLAWLPRRDNSREWWKPADLFATYRAYLFESTGDFVDLDKVQQDECSDVLQWLGVRAEPTVEKVVAHLRNGMRQNKRINQQVYEFLDLPRNCEEPLVRHLGGEACLWVGTGYVQPRSAFWQDVNLGGYAVRLPPEFRKVGRLLAAWGVNEFPGPADAERILRDLSKEFGTGNRPLTEEAEGVAWACWSLLAASSDDDVADWSWLQVNRVVPNSQHLLVEPRAIFIEDRPGLTARFDGSLEPNVIQNTESSEALLHAGVRFLSEVVTGTIADLEEDERAEDVLARITERQDAIRRILTSVADVPFSTLADRIREMDIHYAARLVITYQFTAFRRPIPSAPEEADAFLERSRSCLWVLRSDDAPWAAVARELTLYLLPDRDPGMVAAALTVALSASSADEASRTLDTLGLARTQQAGPAASSPLAESPDATSDPWSPGEVEPAPNDGSRSTGVDGLGVPRLGVEGNEPSELISRSASRNENRPAAVRLRSYVTGGESPVDEQVAREGAGLEVGRRGVALVMEYEDRRNWDAREMAHNNPGYDLISKGPDGKEIYIEVKALSGPWNDVGVGLSKEQFEFARSKGQAAWLYVVEDVFGTAKLYRIQDPARRVTHYHFDNGWRVVAGGVSGGEEL